MPFGLAPQSPRVRRPFLDKEDHNEYMNANVANLVLQIPNDTISAFARSKTS